MEMCGWLYIVWCELWPCLLLEDEDVHVELLLQHLCDTTRDKAHTRGAKNLLSILYGFSAHTTVNSTGIAMESQDTTG